MLLSTALAGCATPAKAPPSTAIAAEARVAPSADMLVCPTPPEGFPRDADATMSPPVRFAAIRLATAYAAVVTQLERLIGWETGKPCPAREAR